MSDTYRLIFWGPGHIGGATLRQALERPEFEVVGALVYSPEKDGRDVGELVGVEPIGVEATADRDAILDLDADCVVYTPRPLDQVAIDRDAIRLLRSSKNVVSSPPTTTRPCGEPTTSSAWSRRAARAAPRFTARTSIPAS